MKIGRGAKMAIMNAHRRLLWDYCHRLRPSRKHEFGIRRALFAGKYSNDDKPTTQNMVLICPAQERDWVLGGICRQIAHNIHTAVEVFWGIDEIPSADTYFLAHYSLIWGFIKKPQLLNSKIIVYYTHPRDTGMQEEKLVFAFNRVAHQVITMNSAHRDYLIRQGVNPYKITTVIGGADPDVFAPAMTKQERNKIRPTVGFCLGFRDSEHYRYRKNYDRIIETITLLGNYSVLLVGHNWRKYERFSEIVSLENFNYSETEYSEYPSQYRRMDVFVSLSRLEGGPIPIIEALASNIPVVATSTGMCPDVIIEGKNGYLLPVDATPQQFATAIEKACALEGDFRRTMLLYSWREFSANILRVARESRLKRLSRLILKY